jgi:hypothetical protein
LLVTKEKKFYNIDTRWFFSAAGKLFRLESDLDTNQGSLEILEPASGHLVKAISVPAVFHPDTLDQSCCNQDWIAIPYCSQIMVVDVQSETVKYIQHNIYRTRFQKVQLVNDLIVCLTVDSLVMAFNARSSTVEFVLTNKVRDPLAGMAATSQHLFLWSSCEMSVHRYSELIWRHAEARSQCYKTFFVRDLQIFVIS